MIRHFLVILFLLVWCDGALSEPLKQQRILILGDSLSAAHGLQPEEGWVALWQGKIKKKRWPVEIINASRSGETTQGARQRLPKLLHQHRPDWVLIELGANDGLRGFPPQVIQKNLSQLIDEVFAQGGKVMLMQIRLPESYGKAYVNAFENIYPRLAELKNVPLIPFLLTPLADRPEMFQSDRIHPTREAQTIIAEFMEKSLTKIIQPARHD